MGVKDVTIFVFVEHTQPRKFVAHEFSHRVVVIHLVLLLIFLGERNVIVKIEITAVRRYPLEPPVHALFVWRELGQRRTRNDNQSYVAMREVPVRPVKMISQIGAAFATLFPARTEHEMINNQLAAALEQIGQSLFSLWAIKDILLLDLGHREFAPRRTKRVALASELLFPRQQILPSNQPLSFRHDLSLFVS